MPRSGPEMSRSVRDGGWKWYTGRGLPTRSTGVPEGDSEPRAEGPNPGVVASVEPTGRMAPLEGVRRYPPMERSVAKELWQRRSGSDFGPVGDRYDRVFRSVASTLD